MKVSITRDEEQKENTTNPAAGDVVSKIKNPAASTGSESGERSHTGRKDPRATQKLARKKRMKAAHRRRLKASHAKG